jgi:hypothetical protein
MAWFRSAPSFYIIFPIFPKIAIDVDAHVDQRIPADSIVPVQIVFDLFGRRCPSRFADERYAVAALALS